MQQGLRKQCIPWQNWSAVLQIPSGKGRELAILSSAMQGLDNDKEGPATLTSEGACSPHAGLCGAIGLYKMLWLNHHDIPLLLSAVTLTLRVKSPLPGGLHKGLLRRHMVASRVHLSGRFVAELATV